MKYSFSYSENTVVELAQHVLFDTKIGSDLHRSYIFKIHGFVVCFLLFCVLVDELIFGISFSLIIWFAIAFKTKFFSKKFFLKSVKPEISKKLILNKIWMLLADPVFELTDQGISEKSSGGTVSSVWKDIIGVWKSDEVIYFVESVERSFCVPPDAVQEFLNVADEAKLPPKVLSIFGDSESSP